MNFSFFRSTGVFHKPWLAAVAVVMLLVVALTWRQHAPTVDSLTLQPQTLVRSVQFSGRVAALTRVEVGSTVTGRVQQVPVREGAQVQAGDALVQLESDELHAAALQAQAAQQQALAHVQGLRGSTRRQTQAALAQTQAGLAAAQADQTRTQQLVSRGFLSPARLDESQRALAVAQALQDAATAQLQANAESGTDLVQAQAQLQAATAASQAAQARLAQTVVRAPSHAQVLLRQVEPGQIVQPGRALLTLALAGVTQLKAQVDERFLSQLATGQPASVVADAFAGQRLAAHVLQIAPLVDAQRGAVEVTLTLDQPAPAFLREDMTLSIEVETARLNPTLVLPLAALRPALGSSPLADDMASVLVLQDGRAQPRQVQLGVRNLQAAQVLAGLQAGDVVLLGSALQPGARVRTRDVTQVQPSSPAAPVQPRANTGSAGGAGAALTNAMGR